MNEETTVSKVSRLLQKSRQAFRIYSSMSKSAKAEHNEYADMQAVEWRNINSELVRQLTHIVEKFSTKNIGIQIGRMRDILLSDYRRVEAELNSEHREIIACTQRGDFIRVAQLARVLISKKAFVQAAQAACHELSLIIDGSQHSGTRNSTNYSKDLSEADQHSNASFLGKSILVKTVPQSTPYQSANLISTNAENLAVGKVASYNQHESITQEEFKFDEVEMLPRMAKVIPLRR